ncbi:MAG: hypothetical protein R2695_09960 [Acidimicrobiales bacterium]
MLANSKRHGRGQLVVVGRGRAGGCRVAAHGVIYVQADIADEAQGKALVGGAGALPGRLDI